MKLVSKSIRVNPALWNHARGIALQRGLTMQTLVDRMLTCYSVRSDWQERVDQAVNTNSGFPSQTPRSGSTIK